MVVHHVNVLEATELVFLEGGHERAPFLHVAAQLPCHPRRSLLCTKPFVPCSCPATLVAPSPFITPSPLSSIFSRACLLISQPWRPLAHLSQPTHSSLATCCHLCFLPCLPRPLLPNRLPNLKEHLENQACALRSG